ncbi:uncharacterized protein LACBIDRAFT_295411 [Laccaria bicolor S238N-H82]|uniref:Predicted protein n=1 Tax=Laccaria bicolor (strain S238N-H82 / ATCC MYA-4686) TaxID=486041 RepID=B0DSA7_LACBS|nr:uncharacterized protein LACBIDRAFT_295411 [Laccaria bicolor S238N-H82]EDR02514.1 predicted protein [Laccaria bicolor S238N-H82]|eukprot:XP_001886877.1 predicted protein [Laccaria bicolor S238N-H82]
MDAVKRRLNSTRAQLETVEKELDGWTPKTAQESQFTDLFINALKEELDKLIQLSEEWLVRKVADHEEEKGRITEIFERINESRVQFEKFLLNGLKPSSIADHKYHLEGEEEQRVRREVCTPGTRVRILNDIITWAKNTSPGSPNVYWLSGQAGSGKSTIAYSIARRFEFAGDPNDTIILGGNFFCSRQFKETRLSKCIIRTVVHHLALKCRAFADQLNDANFEIVNQNVRFQLEDLLIAPWQASKPNWCPDPLNPPPHYLIVIDALDEIDGTGGSEFLRVLIEVIDKNENRLQGLKFFVTSRPDPNLVGLVDSLKSKQRYRLEQAPPEEVQDDIRTYLTVELPHFAGCEEFENLVALTAGLFIYAATIVKYLTRRGHSEQKSFLAKLLASSNSSKLQSLSTASGPFTLLNTLYSQILDKAFHDFSPQEDGWEVRRIILHTFLCTAERTSTSVVANLLFTSDYTDVAEKLLSDLHAVLYCGEHGQVLTYHKSFSDFILDQGRSDNFGCNQAMHHRVLADACFRCMKDGLRFNIANIPSSFVLDIDNSILADAVKENIAPVLSYSSRNWSYHLSAAASIIPDGLHDSISEFLQLRALFWIEAMNLLGLRGVCGSMLRTVHDWVGSFSVTAVAVSPSGKQIVSGLEDKSVRVWDASMGDELKVLKGHTDLVRSIAFSPDGKQIVSGSNDESVRVWDASTGDKLKVLKGHTDSVISVAFSPDGKQIVSGSNDRSVRVWGASTGDELKVLEGHTNLVRSVAFSPDSKQIVSGSYDESVRVWDASTGDKLKVLKGHTVGEIVSGLEDKSVRVWDASMGDELKVLKGHTDLVTSVAFSPDGKQIVSGSDDKSLKVLKGHTHMVRSVAFSPDGKQIVSGSDDKSVWVWDASTGDKLKVLKGHTHLVRSVAFSPDGKKIVSGSDDKSVWVWDASTGDKLKVLKGHTHLVKSVAFSPDGKKIVSGSDDKSVWVWDASTGDKLKVLKGHTHLVKSVAFSPDGIQIVSGSYNKSVWVWDASTGDELKVLKGHTDWITSVAFSPDGNQIVSGSNDNSVRVWDFGSLYIHETISDSNHHENHTGWLLSPDGQHRLMFVSPEFMHAASASHTANATRRQRPRQAQGAPSTSTPQPRWRCDIHTPCEPPQTRYPPTTTNPTE